MFKINICDGVEIEVEDAKQAEAIQFAMSKAGEVKSALDAATAKVDTIQAQLDSANEQIEKLKTAASDEALKARVEAIARVTTSARKVAGNEFTCDSVDPVAIKRAALAVKRPSVDWADKSAAYVEAAFDMAVEEPVVDSQLKQLAKDGAKDIKQPVADAKPVLSRAQEALLRQTGKLK